MAINTESGLPYEATLDSFKWFVGQADDCVYPDGDWPPLLLIETAEVVKVAPLWHYDWSTEEAKDFIAHHVLPAMVRHEQASPTRQGSATRRMRGSPCSSSTASTARPGGRLSSGGRKSTRRSALGSIAKT
jgi:hypothetical protein